MADAPTTRLETALRAFEENRSRDYAGQILDEAAGAAHSGHGKAFDEQTPTELVGMALARLYFNSDRPMGLILSELVAGFKAGTETVYSAEEARWEEWGM